MDNCRFNYCAPYGSQYNPVVINKILQADGTDILITNKPILDTFNNCCKAHCFYIYIPECFVYGDTGIVVYSEDAGTSTINVLDRIGNYVRADRLLPYDGGKCLVKCMYCHDPIHINVVSEIIPTHFGG